MSNSPIPRHFTATGFVINGDATLLHWHHRVKAWLPPGGHVEPDEDPVQAVLREVKEETGLDVELIPTQQVPHISDIWTKSPRTTYHPRRRCLRPKSRQTPTHRHDVLLPRPRPSPQAAPDGWVWFTADDLSNGRAATNPDGISEPPPEDVVTLGLEGIHAAA